ncbi:MAG: hypothetical protein ACRC5T_01300 [Cetobacterium sp.]
MARKPAKARLHVKKKRGDAKFIEQNAGLIRNVAKENGLCSFSVEMGDYLKPEITPELITLTKQKLNDVVKLRSAEKQKKKPTNWENMEAAIKKYDRTNKTQVWQALMIWLERNPSVNMLQNSKKVSVLSQAAKRMILASDQKAGRFPNRNDINGYGSAAPAATINMVHKFK